MRTCVYLCRMAAREGSSDDSSDDEWTRPARATDAVAAGTSDDPCSATTTLDTSKPTQKVVDYSWDEDERMLAGSEVGVVFVLHDGSRTDTEPVPLDVARFVMGVTVAHLKMFLADHRGIAYDSQRLLLGSVQLIDPLSLNDCQFQAGADNVVDVYYT